MSVSTSTRALREAGAALPLPFRLDVSGGGGVEMRNVLRLLPGRRIAGEALWQGRRVLAKVFLGRDGRRHGERERAGVESLNRAGLAAPALLHAGPAGDDGYVVVTAWLEDARTLAEIWEDPAVASPGAEGGLEMLRAVLSLFGQMHARGLAQADPHLGNLLVSGGRPFLIDGDAVGRLGQPPAENALRNLALLLAQLSPAWDAWSVSAADAWEGESGYRADPELLRAAIRDARAWRLRRFLPKTVRNCTQFRVDRSGDRFRSALRSLPDDFLAALDGPDALVGKGRLLKDGRTCTVAACEVSGREVVIKRYNLKGLGHALSRAWRPSRAWHAWREAHRLLFLGIATPRPLAMIEERFGYVRRRAFLVTEFSRGRAVSTLLHPDAPPSFEMGSALREMFVSLAQCRITHGDLKASNLLWNGAGIELIDLDACRAHRLEATFRRAWRSDRARFLANWPEGSVLHRWFDDHLPAA